MRQARIVAWACLVVGGGIGVALPFRRTAAPEVAQTVAPATDELERRAEPMTLQVAARPIVRVTNDRDASAPIPGKVAPSAPPVPINGEIAPSSSVATSSTPRLATTVPLPQFSPESSPLKPVVPPAMPLVKLPQVKLPSEDRQHAGAAPTSSSIVPTRRHRISDGDTLASIAGRYLDDEQRWPDVYRLNRELLTDPDLLPIGKEIRIPPKNGITTEGPAPDQASTSRPVNAPTADVDSGSGESVQSPVVSSVPLVPVPLRLFRMQLHSESP